MAASFTTYYHSPLGLIKISGTESFIAEIQFIDTIQHPPTDHHKKPLPQLAIHAIEELIQYFNGQRRVFDLLTHQEGTPFQQAVWNELKQIPFGRTISYMELARRIGDAKSIRAAAAANGKNHIAILIPCHRVIGSKNDLVGYAGGLWRKKWLLDHENKIANGVLTLF